MLSGPFDLVLEHGYISLETLVDLSLSLHLSLHRLQVLQLNEVRLDASLLKLLGNLAGNGSGFTVLLLHLLKLIVFS